MITYERAKQALLEAVAEKGESYIYEPPIINGEPTDCVYSTPPEAEQEPSCIVGHVIYKLDPERFREIAEDEWKYDEADPEYGEGGDAWSPQTDSVNGLAATYGDLFDERAEILLSKAQYRQDRGRAWGDAVKESIRELENK
jgi:hypothetical protein